MSEVSSARRRGRTLVILTLTLLGMIGIGRLAYHAWMLVQVPDELPELGARGDDAPPFCLLIVDGLREQRAWGTDDPAMPWLQSFAKRGAWGTAIVGEPTLTAPCVRALLTGRRPDLLTGLRNFEAPQVRRSLVGYLKARGAHTAHGGDAAAYQFCRPHYEEVDVKAFLDQGPTDQGQCDLEAVPHVLARIEAGATCVTMHLTKPDHAGHKYGALGREYWEACNTVDGQLRVVTEAFLARHPQGTILIASDHGVSNMGTHGGGESGATRAPFALVGPGVARVHLPSKGKDDIVDQCALAPTVCALLGLPQLPLADAPPDLRLIDLSPELERQALLAYLGARLRVAYALHGDEADVIERRRAELTVDELILQVNQLLRPNSALHAAIALLVAMAWLTCLVGLVSRPALPRRASLRGQLLLALGCTVGVFYVLEAVTWPVNIAASPVALGLSLLAVCAVAVRLYRLDAWRGAGVTLGCLVALPVFTAAGYTIQETFTAARGDGGELGRASLAFLGVGVLAATFLRPRRLGRRLGQLAEAAPGLVPAFGGVLVGFTLTLRPFIDPHVRSRHLYAAAALAIIAWMVFSPAGRRHKAWERLGLAGIGVALFLATRIAEGSSLIPWVNGTPKADTLWLFVGLAGIAAVCWLVPRPTRADTPGLVLAGLSLLAAYAVRLDEAGAVLPQSTAVVLAVSVTALAALGWTLVRGSADGRLLVRLLAAFALARRLSVMDAEFAAYVVAGLGAALLARRTVPTGRVALAWLAVAILALRTALFHAMGFVESFDTIDVGGAFTGLAGGTATAVDGGEQAGMTWQVMVASLQLALRMALPWVLILAALARAVERTPGATPGHLRCVLTDLSLSFAARNAALVTALLGWWRNIWWIPHAYTAFIYAFADVVFLLLCATLCGAWQRDPREALAVDARQTDD